MRPGVIGACLLVGAAVLTVQQAIATPITVTVKSADGGAAADAVVVFDPLDATPPPGHDRASIDQVKKTFVPAVTVVRTGTAVTFPNSDQIHHEVYSTSPAKTFEMPLYAGVPKAPIIFDKAGLVVLGCNIHDKMLAFVAVVDSPYFAKISPSGSASFNLPAGRYGLRVWHPLLRAAVPTQAVTVAAEPQSLAIQLNLAPGNDPVAAWH